MSFPVAALAGPRLNCSCAVAQRLGAAPETDGAAVVELVLGEACAELRSPQPASSGMTSIAMHAPFLTCYRFYEGQGGVDERCLLDADLFAGEAAVEATEEDIDGRVAAREIAAHEDGLELVTVIAGRVEKGV